MPGKTHYRVNARGRALLQAAVKRHAFDLVILNTADLLPLLGVIPPGIGRVLLSHNVETEVLRRQIDGLRVPGWLRRLLGPEVGKIRRMEEAGARQVDLILAISKADADWYRERGPACPVEVLATPFPGAPFQGPRPTPSRPLKLAYVAKMTWAPNRAGAGRLVRDVVPAVAASAAEFHFYGPGTEAYEGLHPALRGHGAVETLDEVWRSTHFTLCPIENGSGAGQAVVALPLEDCTNFLESERADALAATTVPADMVAALSAAGQIDRVSRLLSQAVKR